MSISFETLGNATIMVFQDGEPVLATDPWMVGTAYFGSWALERPLTQDQINNIKKCKYIWFSHGHPDHLHTDSVDMLPRTIELLVPDLYNSDIPSHLREMGFTVRVLKYREWLPATDKVRICCLDNINQDAILAIDTPDGIIINKNDSPLCGELGFLRNLIKKHPRNRAYLTALYSGGADMMNIVDASGQRIIAPPQDFEIGKAMKIAREAERLGVGSFCCSSAQHVYARADTLWANEYGMDWRTLEKYWNRPDVRLIRPFVTINMSSGEVTYNDSGADTIPEGIDRTGDDDWNEKPDEADWNRISDFFLKFETLRDDVDIIAVTIGGERRDFTLNPSVRAVPKEKLRIVHFTAPRKSFMETITWGYFDDMLIGNFMKTELVNVTLYPNFSPKIAKYGGNAKIFTNQDMAKFRWHYLSRNPGVYLSMTLSAWFENTVVDGMRKLTERLGVKPFFKWIYRKAIGDLTPLGADLWREKK
ncbi:MAG: hypothetical protein ABL951_14825 [Alphaproteobacteria bacterium]